MKKETKEINRRYIITSKELKEKFNFKGNVSGINLWTARNSHQEEKGVSADKDEWEIETIEKF